MSIIGIFASDPAETDHLLRLFLDLSTRRQRLRTLAFPPEAPVIAAVVFQDQLPTVQWNSRADGGFALLDGELYNAEELRQSVHENGNDANTLLDLYLSSGEDAIVQADMAGSLAIWDPGRQRLLVYRDRIGQMPVYYLERPGAFLWSSNLKTILGTGAGWTMNRLALDAFLACGYVPAPWTFVEGIKKVPPGHVLTCERGKTPMCRYIWHRHSDPNRALNNGEVAKEQLGDLFTQALRRRYTPGVRTGVLLSGGVDSKLIVAGLVRLLGIPGDTIDTFTFRYAEYEGKYNELELAEQAARYFGTRHHEITVRPVDIPNNLEHMLRCFEEPFTYGLHTFMASDVAKTGVRVALTGAGLGALSALERYALRYARLPIMLQRASRSLVSAMWLSSETVSKTGPSIVSRAAHHVARRADELAWIASNDLPLHCAATIIPDRFRRWLYCDKDFAETACGARNALFRAATADCLAESPRNRMRLLTERFFEAECNLYWYQAAGRAHGLIFRHPFRANALDCFVLGLPEHDMNKKEIRQFAARLMPNEMAYTAKVPQSVPLMEWLRGPLVEFLRDTLSAERLKAHGLFDHKAVQRLIDLNTSGRAHLVWGLWGILTVLVWERVFLGRSELRPESVTQCHFAEENVKKSLSDSCTPNQIGRIQVR
jgi:asparagine synthase (glutamine-hydrolysing)